MSKFKLTLVIIGILILPVGLASYNLYFYKFFAPKFQNIKREVFKGTRSYNEGKIQQLAKLKIEYETASEDSKQVLKTTIGHMFADYQAEDMPYQLKVFLTKMRGY